MPPGTFHYQIGIAGRSLLKIPVNHRKVHRIALQLGRQVRGYRCFVQIGKQQVFRFPNLGKTVDETRIRLRHRVRSADSRLVVARVITALTQGLDQQRCNIRFADIRVCTGNEKSV